MKKPYFLFIICFATLSTVFVNAQTIEYAYDMAGNRISRKVVTMPQGVKHDYHTSDSVVVTETIGERAISVYPNPTKGQLSVEISGGSSEDAIQLTVYDGQGKILITKKAEQGRTPLEMTTYPAGWYILRVTGGDKSKEFKIVKQ